MYYKNFTSDTLVQSFVELFVLVFFSFILCQREYAHVYRCPQRPEDDARSLRTGVTGVFVSSLVFQQALLTTGFHLSS